MNILLDTHMVGYEETGNERYWKNLTDALKKYKKIDFQIRKYSGLNNGLFRILMGFKNNIDAYKTDLIHVQNFTPIIKTIPTVNTIHDLCFKENPGLFGLKTNLAFKFFFNRSLRQSDAIICPSNITKNQLLKFYNLDPNKIFVVYDAADESFYYIRDKKRVKNLLEKKFGIKNKYFLVVGNIQSRKLPFTIIKVFNEIQKKFPKIMLVFAGPNKLRLKQSNNIKILGYINDSDLNVLYNGATALIYLSLCEGFGLPLVEAMATKTPIICSDLPVFKEISKNCALYVNSQHSLKKTVLNLFKRRGLRTKFSQLSYQRSRFFNWHKTAVKTFNVYRKVLDIK